MTLRRLQVFRLDDLFVHEKLGFAQIDVDGSELSLLKGATATIARDRPFFSTELHVHENPEESRRILRFIKAMGYSSYLVEEIAGNRVDIRNLLHFPIEATPRLSGSSTLDLASQSRKLFAVDASTITDFAFPCCAQGRACCPYERGRTSSCCSHWRVSQWMESAIARGGADVQWGTRTTWYDQQYWMWGPQLAHLQHQEMRRNQSGFSYNKRPPTEEYRDQKKEFAERWGS